MKKLFYIFIFFIFLYLLFIQFDTKYLEDIMLNSNYKLPFDISNVQLLNYIIIALIIIGLLTIFIVTERNLEKVNKIIKQKTKDLEAQKNKLELVVSLFDKNVLATKVNAKNEIIYISEAYCIDSGFSKEDVVGKNHNVLRYFNLTKKLKDVEFEDDRISIDLVNIKKDGSKYWVKAVFIPEFDDTGKYIGYNTIEEDVSQRKIMEQMSITDALTSLYNRRYFDQVFPQKLKEQNTSKLVLAIIDIDFFKQYNDIYGHQAGDKTLKKVAKILNNSLFREGDMVFRLGGEEFGMLFNVKNKEDVINIANNTLNNILNAKIEHKGSKVNQYVTISLGMYIIEKTETSEHIIYQKADELLYEAKKTGRNKFISNINETIIN